MRNFASHFHGEPSSLSDVNDASHLHGNWSNAAECLGIYLDGKSSALRTRTHQFKTLNSFQNLSLSSSGMRLHHSAARQPSASLSFVGSEKYQSSMSSSRLRGSSSANHQHTPLYFLKSAYFFSTSAGLPHCQPQFAPAADGGILQ